MMCVFRSALFEPGDAGSATLRDRMTLAVGSALGLVYGPDGTDGDSHVEFTSAYMQRLSLAFAFAYQYGTHAKLVSPTGMLAFLLLFLVFGFFDFFFKDFSNVMKTVCLCVLT